MNYSPKQLEAAVKKIAELLVKHQIQVSLSNKPAAKPVQKPPAKPARPASSNTPKNAMPKAATKTVPAVPPKKVVPADRSRTLKPKLDHTTGKSGKNKFLKDLAEWLHKK